MFDEHFMLTGELSKTLYNDIAKTAPIYDFHCHLSAREIYEDQSFCNISKVFLQFDHYKWRAMRIAGVPEDMITGGADDLVKFRTWAKTCERLIGSPLYHWTNLELKAYFGVDEVLKEANAERIYQKCNDKIARESLSPVKLIRSSNVKLICTTDDPTDDLQYHKLLAMKEDLGFQVLPTFRPDKAVNILNDVFLTYIEVLESRVGVKITGYQELLAALSARIDYFNSAGCRLSDHSIESLTYFAVSTEEADQIVARRLAGETLSVEEAEKYKCCLWRDLAAQYHRLGWAMQLHIGAMRNNNGEMFKKLGPDAGFDVMNDFDIAPHLSKLLNAMNDNDGLPKTILYTLNPKDNIVLSALPHCFCEDGVPGKIQFGAAWWFLDHKEGILQHLKAVASQGMLAQFVGMLTDSRSFLSYTRHDYFRRILCSYVGGLVEAGEFENDSELLREIIEGICYRNIKNYLALED